MTDDAWKRHANPWSVWTRFAAIPLMILAIWSRVWLGWWCLVPVAAVIVWLWLNPRVFAPVETPTSWAAKGIYGEKLWLKERDRVPPSHLRVLRLLIPIGAAGFVLLVYGLVTLEVWPTVFGATLIVLGSTLADRQARRALREHALACAAVTPQPTRWPRWPSCRAWPRRRGSPRGAGPGASPPHESAGMADDGGRGRAAGRTGVLGARRWFIAAVRGR